VTRIAYLSTDPGIPYGGTKGASVHMAEITAALARQGAEVLVLAAAVSGSAHPPPGVVAEGLPGPGKGTSVDERLAAERQRTAWLVRRLGDFGPSCLYERFALHSAAGSEAARTLGIPHMVELNAPLREEAARYRVLDRVQDAERLEARVLTGADLVLSVSRPLADYATLRGAQDVAVLANAVAIERFPERPFPPPSTPPRAVFTGALRPWHGVGVVAEAWRLLGDMAPELLVIGDGPGRELLEDMGATVTGAVRHDEVPSLLRPGDIGLAPYSADGPRYFSPLKLYEYLAAGLAVVAGDLPGVVDAIGAEPAAAVVVPAGSAAALAEAVAGLVSEPELRRQQGRAGRALVAAHHTWDHRARSVLAGVGTIRAAGVTA
jgi:glycosyltransferase involved in cell wall biosynthesis